LSGLHYILDSALYIAMKFADVMGFRSAGSFVLLYKLSRRDE
jgi:hypothetical protein